MRRQKAGNDGNTGKEKGGSGGSNNVCFSVSDVHMAHGLAAVCVCQSKVSPDAIANATRRIHPTFRIDLGFLSRNCKDIYQVTKEKLRGFLENFVGQVSLSMDVLKKYDGGFYHSHHKRDKELCFMGYMCVRVHLVDENWKLRDLVLDCSRVDAELYVEMILMCLKDFNILTKISSIMVLDDFDGAKIHDAIKSKIHWKQGPPHMFSIRCCASLLCLMVEDTFEAIEMNKFLELYGVKRAFPMWDNILSQLTYTLELEASGFFNNDDIRKYHDIPSAEEWKRLRDVCRLVSLVNDAAEVLYKTHNVTASLYLYNLQKLRTALIKESVSSDQFVSKMALSMLQKLYEYWKDTFMVLAFATILDPRCKMKFIEFVSLKFEGVAGNSQIGLVLEAFHTMYNEYRTRFTPRVGPTCSESEHKIDEDMNHKNRRLQKSISHSHGFHAYAHFIQTNLQPARSGFKQHPEEPISLAMHNTDWGCLLRAGLMDSVSESESEPDSDSDPEAIDELREQMKKKRKRLANPRLANPRLAFDSLDEYNNFTQSNWKLHKSELDLYLEEPVFPWSQDLNLLSWWRAARAKYPTLSRMARDLIAIPFSLSTNDDAFYTDLRPFDVDLIHLKKDLRKALMCTRTWTWTVAEEE